MEKQTKVKFTGKLNKVMKILTWALMAVLGLAIVGMLFIHFSPDYGFYYVKSGSMRPSIQPGDIVITGPVGGWFTGNLKEGKVITFKDFNAIVTHRIVSIQNGLLRTKGDANEDADNRLVSIGSVQGIYLFKIPLIGYVNGFVSNRAGWFIVIIIPTILLVLFLVKDIIKEALKVEKKNETKQTKGGDAYQAVQKDGKQAIFTRLDPK